MATRNLEPDLIFVNANVRTMDDIRPQAEAIAIHHSKIVAVGLTDILRRLKGTTTKIVNLNGKLVLPGFVDSHIHFLSFARSSRQVNLDGVSSVQAAVNRVKTAVDKTKAEKWVIGRGWDKNLWKRGCFPLRQDLDRVSAVNPVALRSKDGHCLWVNTKALSIAAITRKTPDPEGGEIVRDKSGKATGILKEKATHLVESLIPEPSQETTISSLMEAIKIAHAHGLTSLHVPEDRNAFLAFQTLHSRGKLRIRIFMLLPKEMLAAAIECGLQTGFGNDKLRIGGLKLFIDGALGSQTAAMLEPYEDDPKNRGIVVTSMKKSLELITQAACNGFNVAAHAIGDRANCMALNAMQKAQSRVTWKTRNRIEHAQHLTENIVKKFSQIGIIASIQPCHIALDMDTADRYLGKRSRWAYPLRSLLDAGVTLTFGSDCPVASMNPLLGIHAAVTRQKVDGYPLGGWHPHERITVKEAVKAYTIDAAYASGEETIKGSIQVGKLADLVVLSKNIFTIPEDEIHDVKVDMTIFDGTIVYVRKDCAN
jgi:predicted amidohydrolase YtcJ